MSHTSLARTTDARTGVLYTRVVGRRYYEAAPSPGEPLALLRDPENAFDANAVAVHIGPAGPRVGHIPREHAAWLAPLLDDGLVVSLAGMLAEEDKPQGSPTLRVVVTFRPGFDIEEVPSAPSEKTLWHDLVVRLWHQRETVPSHVLQSVYRELRQSVLSAHVHPVTRLLLKFIDGFARDADYAEALRRMEEERKRREERQRRQEALRERIRSAIAAEPCGRIQDYGTLRILPLRAMRGAVVETLPEAFAVGHFGFRIEERVRPDKNRAPEDLPYLRQVSNTANPVLAVHGARLETSRGVLCVQSDDVLFPEEVPYVDLLPEEDAAHARILPVGVSGAAPALPGLPDDATGFAVFWGSRLLHIRLFGSYTAAVQALGALPEQDWHIGNGTPPIDGRHARAQVASVFQDDIVFQDQDDEDDGNLEQEIRFPSLGVRGPCWVDESGALMALSLSFEESWDFHPAPQATACDTELLDNRSFAQHRSTDDGEDRNLLWKLIHHQ